jgi:hypothetical protein
MNPVPAALVPAVPSDCPVVLSWGLGVDSTAVLLRWLTDPTCRDFALGDLVVVVAMTGDEWARTGADATAHVLPVLREHGVRLVQVARARRLVTKAGDGVSVLDDSTTSQVLHLPGAFTLGQELADAGTVPQTGGSRLCSVHAKGDALDPVIAALTAGRAYRHAVGFEAGETRRAVKDTRHNTARRTGWYPLIEWGWDRAKCLAFLRSVTGTVWTKSACVFCPYALSTRAGRAAVIARLAVEEPRSGVRVLTMEATAVALNPRQGLVAGKRLADYVRALGHRSLVEAFEAHLDAVEHTVYEVRRVWPAHGSRRPRSITSHATGTRAEMSAVLHRLASNLATTVEVDDDGFPRAWLRHRGPGLPDGEHFLTLAPAGVHDKQARDFPAAWAALPAPHAVSRGRQLTLQWEAAS